MAPVQNRYLRQFVAVYFGLFLLISGLSFWFVSAFSGELWAASALATGVLTAFGLLGIALTVLIGRSFIRPLKVVTEYTTNILDGNYAGADEAAMADAVPGLGDLVHELSSRFKERLGFSNSILEGLPVPICIVDTRERITFLNQECLKMLGSNEDPKSYYGKMISQIFYKDDRKSLIGTCMDENTRTINREGLFKHVDGSDIHARINAFPLTDVEGVIIGGCCLYLDTTELKRREAEIVSQHDRLATAASQATEVSEELATAASQLESVVIQARSGTRTQSERTGETATAMEEMTATVLEVARLAQDAALNADDARQQAEEGAGIVTQVVSSIDEVAGHAHDLKISMEELDERADKIGKVLGVIEDIADQTNLLALNAAIEAARAGDAGRGFAVVADEVRKLAEKTMEATREVHLAITGIQDGARKNVKATEVAVVSVGKTTEMAGRSGEALHSIVSVAEATADRVRNIATAAEQQSAASEEINEATVDVSRVCQDTDGLMTDASDAITRLSELAKTLGKIIREMQ
ncbi:methyl-accepting chemotaxis protein [Pseudodesulfovibrio piezophilus]|uniref:Methyl-accepting chemotaxis sensory transducer with Pas/Pac sensor n=1 Tax=Pseudodesulfovibrio piezophilus (strain DSM 21447 / JCM 15486 / C1TLV30) TaxID=1322246 RepID=M1WU94_PSEP2|nr:methyl-accepting chemotaxis protein [Pseudodesulfovibrio piezophilus]CCH50392.1 Methyl-accepting chemotaxis sensory transducer with Pas/Pac sensor [Pseudodesulfovibrio piezophilus C1TLV30]